MNNWKGYEKGINLGGWLSQCEYSLEHFENFITEADFKQIKAWGFDHVRLPFDYNVLQDNSGHFYENGFHYLDLAVNWAIKTGLNIILDLHKTTGFSFDKEENEVGLFGNQLYEKYFMDLWILMAARYGKIGPNVSFELLNEVTSPSFNDGWMRLAEATIKEIRRIAPNVTIIFGGYWNNSPDAIKDMINPPDKNVFYTFHSYDPMCFTHQGAGWVDAMPLDYRLKYPFNFEGPEVEGAKSCYEKMLMPWPKGMSTEEQFEQKFASALQVAKERNVLLYCGEYGVIDLADPESTLNWYKDIHKVLNKYGIGHCIWNYKGKNFGLSSSHYDTVRDEILRTM